MNPTKPIVKVPIAGEFVRRGMTEEIQERIFRHAAHILRVKQVVLVEILVECPMDRGLHTIEDCICPDEVYLYQHVFQEAEPECPW